MVAQILVRDVEDEVKARLRRRAARHGRSMEAEVRDILRAATAGDDGEEGGLGREIVALFEGIGLTEVEEIPELRGNTIRDPFA